MTPYIVLIYGILVAAGGVMGYAKANSAASLASGGVAGALLIICSVAMMRGAYTIGWWISLVIALLLLARFSYASIGNFKMMPGGMVIVLSIITIIALIIGRSPKTI